MKSNHKDPKGRDFIPKLRPRIRDDAIAHTFDEKWKLQPNYGEENATHTLRDVARLVKLDFVFHYWILEHNGGDYLASIGTGHSTYT